jgi:tol-pal system protein YbgF
MRVLNVESWRQSDAAGLSCESRMRRLSIIVGALFLLGTALPFAAVSAQDSPNKASADATEKGGGDVDKRLQRLEEQLVDLSAQLGTVETMARSGGGASEEQSADNGTSSGSDSARLAQLEVEVRALSSQVNEILQRLQQLDGRASSNVSPPSPMASSQTGAPPPPGGANQDSGFGATDVEPATPNAQSASRPVSKPKKKKSGGLFFGLFGNDEESESDGSSASPEGLTPRESVPQGDQRMNNSDASPSDSLPAQDGGSDNGTTEATRQVQASLSPAEAKSVYDSAFMALQEGNPRLAAEGFEKFIQGSPNDPMVGSAHFWLGEAAFTNGEYRKAADSYLKTATDFPHSEKAAESLFKLGISLKRLNEIDAACSTFDELARRFPDATTLLNRAQKEKRRANCS